MFDLLLNAGKLLISKDARDAGSALLELVRRSPEWQRDNCTMTLCVDRTSREQTDLIRELCVEKLQALGYPNQVVGAFQTSYVELVENAFEHGLSNKRNARIEIQVDVTSSYISLIVRNNKGIRFDPATLSAELFEKLKAEPGRSRGRGLLAVRALADEFESVDGGESLKVVFYHDAVEIEVYTFRDLVILRLVSGIFNRSGVGKRFIPLSLRAREWPGEYRLQVPGRISTGEPLAKNGTRSGRESG